MHDRFPIPSFPSKLLAFYKKARAFVFAPKQSEQTVRNREVVLILLVITTFLMFLSLFAVMLISYWWDGNEYVLGRAAICMAALLFLSGIYVLGRIRHYWLAAYLLVGFYLAISSAIVWQWGINTPFGIFLFAIVIVLAGSLLGSRFALYAALAATGVLIGVQWSADNGLRQPVEEWSGHTASYGDVVGYAIAFIVLALIAFVFGREMERSLKRAEKAEAALQEEKTLLAIRVEERTAALQAAQFEEMQQMYRFAELGHLSTAMLHELANHLTTLTLDIEDLHRQRSSRVIMRARNSIHYLDAMVDRVRQQLRGSNTIRPFRVETQIQKVIKIVRQKADGAGVKLTVEKTPASATIRCKGDTARFNQILAILLTNAIEAYDQSPSHSREVAINVKQLGSTIHISVTDWGKGITAQQRDKLFKPFYGNKEKGMGIGLYIARGILETHFKGKISLGPSKERTEFILTIPAHQ